MRPRLATKARVRPDPRDGQSVLLSPERGLRLSTTATAIVEKCDGTRSLEQIVEELCACHRTSDRLRIDGEVRDLVATLRSRGLIDDADTDRDFREDRNRARPLDAPRSSLSSSGDATPYTLVAELTHRCPLACPYCSNPRQLVRGNDEMRTEEWIRVLDEAALLGVMQVHLTGGEPLARADLEAIAAHAASRDLYVNLVTSGIPLDRTRLARLAPSIDHLQLSVQDADAASSDWIAGLAAHDAKLRVAGWVKELGVPLTLNVVLHRANLDRIEAIVAFAERLGVDRLELANVQLVSWALENAAELLPTSAQIQRARGVAQAAKERLAGSLEVVFVLPDWHADRPRACMDGWARRFVVVAPDGAVLPCHAARSLPLVFESVRDAPLGRIWECSEALRAFRGEAWMPAPCNTCERRTIDFGGCRCQAFALTGDLRATDPACSLAPSHALVLAARERADEQRPSGRLLYRGR
jgi:pyrroloquinoline quinone biosynthesis protein E